MDNTSTSDIDFDSEFEDDTENNVYRRQAEEDPYIQLMRKCKRLLKELNRNNYEEIRKTLLKNKNEYQNKYDTISKEMYKLIRKLIEMRVDLTYSLNDMKNLVMIKIKYYDTELGDINKGKNYYIDQSALHDVTSTHSSIYNTRQQR